MSRNTILSILNSGNGYVSGEQLSSKIGISRAAINSYVKKLKSDGFEIESVTNKGYRLVSCPNIIDKGLVMSFLSKERCENVFVYDSVTSTNDLLKPLAQNGGAEGTVIVSNEQTAGRGRLGRTFESPHNTGIYFSYLFRPTTNPSDISEVTAWVAVAVSRAIKKATGIAVDIKWINDLVLNKKKICGILNELSVESESFNIQYMITGIGINVDDSSLVLPDELSNIASSLQKESGKKIDKNLLVAEMINELDQMKLDWPEKRDVYLAEYRKSCVNKGKRVSVYRGETVREAEAIDIDDHFRLVVRYDDGSTEAVSSGEVSVRGLYGYV